MAVINRRVLTPGVDVSLHLYLWRLFGCVYWSCFVASRLCVTLTGWLAGDMFVQVDILKGWTLGWSHEKFTFRWCCHSTKRPYSVPYLKWMDGWVGVSLWMWHCIVKYLFIYWRRCGVATLFQLIATTISFLSSLLAVTSSVFDYIRQTKRPAAAAADQWKWSVDIIMTTAFLSKSHILFGFNSNHLFDRTIWVVAINRLNLL